MWQILKVERYPALATYSGEYTAVLVEFKTSPEQIPFTKELGQWLADQIPSEAEKRGATPLFMIVSWDTAPTFWTNWEVIFWAHGPPIEPATLCAIIIGAIVTLGIIYYTWRMVRSWTRYRTVKVEKEVEIEEARKTLLVN